MDGQKNKTDPDSTTCKENDLNQNRINNQQNKKNNLNLALILINISTP